MRCSLIFITGIALELFNLYYVITDYHWQLTRYMESSLEFGAELAAQIIISSLEFVQAINYHPVYINYIISTVNQKSQDIGHCGEIINIWMPLWIINITHYTYRIWITMELHLHIYICQLWINMSQWRLIQYIYKTIKLLWMPVVVYNHSLDY